MHMVAHGTKRASEVEEELKHGVSEFIVPAYYWTGGSWPNEDYETEEIAPIETASVGFRIVAESITAAMSAMTEICAQHEGDFVYFDLDLEEKVDCSVCVD